MKMKKWGVLAVSAAMVAALGLFGCSGGDAKPAEDKKAEEPKTEAPAEMTLMKEGTLTILSSPDYPPFENLENGEIVGYEVDLFNAIADEMGLKLEIQPLQFDGIIPAIQAGGQGDVGVSGFSVDPERAQQIDFTETF